MTVKQFVSKEEAIELYNTLKKVNKQDVEKIADSPTESGTILLFSKIANASTENDFVTALTSGEIPAIKLSTQETEMLRGGVKVTNPNLSCFFCPSLTIICKLGDK